MDSLLRYLSSYQFKIKGSIDTVGTSKITMNGKAVTAHHVSIGMDGITVKGSYGDEYQIKDFAFWSPKVNSENHKLVMMVFALMETNLEKKTIQNYIVKLKGYF